MTLSPQPPPLMRAPSRSPPGGGWRAQSGRRPPRFIAQRWQTGKTRASRRRASWSCGHWPRTPGSRGSRRAPLAWWPPRPLPIRHRCPGPPDHVRPSPHLPAGRGRYAAAGRGACADVPIPFAPPAQQGRAAVTRTGFGIATSIETVPGAQTPTPSVVLALDFGADGRIAHLGVTAPTAARLRRPKNAPQAELPEAVAAGCGACPTWPRPCAAPRSRWTCWRTWRALESCAAPRPRRCLPRPGRGPAAHEPAPLPPATMPRPRAPAATWPPATPLPPRPQVEERTDRRRLGDRVVGADGAARKAWNINAVTHVTHVTVERDAQAVDTIGLFRVVTLVTLPGPRACARGCAGTNRDKRDRGIFINRINGLDVTHACDMRYSVDPVGESASKRGFSPSQRAGWRR